MEALQSVLGEALSAVGASGAALVDAVTGFTYAELGDCMPAGSGHEVCQLLRLVDDGLHEAGAQGELESVVVTGRRSYHLVQVVPRQGDPLLISMLLDRSGSNLALASRQVTAAAKALRV